MLTTTGYWKFPDQMDVGGIIQNWNMELPWNLAKVMTLNTPMVVYGDRFGVEHMKIARGSQKPGLLWHEEVTYKDLPPCATHEMQIRKNESHYTNPVLVPSIMLGCIWSGKFELIRRSYNRFPDYAWYSWVDAGMHAAKWDVVKRDNHAQWPDKGKLAQLPPRKVSISRTGDCDKCTKGQWNFCECVSPTAILVPAKLVLNVTDLFYKYLAECMTKTKAQPGLFPGYSCMNEQVVMTQMVLEKPNLFNIVGKAKDRLGQDFASQMYEGKSDLFDWVTAGVGEATTMLASSSRP